MDLSNKYDHAAAQAAWEAAEREEAAQKKAEGRWVAAVAVALALVLGIAAASPPAERGPGVACLAGPLPGGDACGPAGARNP